MSPWRATRLQNVLFFYVFRPLFRPTGSSILMCFVAKGFLDEGSEPPRPAPQDPHRNSAQNDVPARPPLFSDLQWWLKRSEQRATEDMTSVGTEDIWRHLGGWRHLEAL